MGNSAIDKKVIILLIFLVCSTFLAFYIKQEGIIIWSSERHLSWEDFKAKPIDSNPHDAGSSVGISYHFKSKSNTIEINSVFYTLESWVKVDQKSSTLLNHEQGHFNITEIYSRKLRQKLSGKKFKKKNFEKEFKSIYDQVVKDMESMQENYDIETNFSKNDGLQSSWNSKIFAELEELKYWSCADVSLIIK